ncbi:SDR family oxidoreductase [Actinokineospora sp. UTMC 2448]|uniref:SDR family oxidoreductase n=1 Tax=Actinokineospora sp. UTMC 2448 TaxID=2268449 RepID=UPI002164E290|nr:SDR family oxidoreductase [Actinokineospora sp. UTMC 2448]UVS79359.1 Putative oxidoreductase SadH [Actinokineospora sp. UTMC 2448]
MFRARYPAIDLADAVVVVTGGARGIGLATARAFAAAGATVCAGDLDGTDRRLDVTSRESYAAFVDDVLAAHGRIDVLVNNAGVMPLGGFLEEPDALSRVTMDVNVWGVINGLRLVLPGMLARGRGHVVTIASMAGKIAIPGMAVYNASKYAALGLTAAVRREYADSGVSVSAVLPSAVRTELSSGAPVGRGLALVEPEDVAAAVVGSCRTRKAEIAVPGYLAAWDVLAALAPEPVMRWLRTLADDRRALRVDRAARAEYERRIARQIGNS